VGRRVTETDVRDDFIEALSVVIPAELSRMVLTNSGSEAVEVAIRLAREATHRTRVVAMTGAYHGTTQLAAMLSDQRRSRRPGHGVQDVVRVPFDDPRTLEEALDSHVAAVIVEPVQWSAGVRVPDGAYLTEVQALCRRSGALLIIDEVQTALRSWPPLFSAAQRVVPDILCLGASIANGFPVGAAVLRETVASKSPRDLWESTTAGNPLACAAGAATLRVMAEPAMRVRVSESGRHLQARLRALRIGEIKEVRGEGTMAGVELHGDATRVVNVLRKLGVLVDQSPAGVIRLLPPSIIDNRQVDVAVEKLAAAIVESRRIRRGQGVSAGDVELRGVATRPRRTTKSRLS